MTKVIIKQKVIILQSLYLVYNVIFCKKKFVHSLIGRTNTLKKIVDLSAKKTCCLFFLYSTFTIFVL